VAETISRETGKPVGEALVVEVVTVLDMLRFAERVAPGFLAPSRFGSASLALWRKRFTTRREPYGVLGVISPWNYPFMLPAGQVTSAIVAGNAVVLKPSELTPSCGDLLASLFHEAGCPEGVLQVVHGAGDAGAALVEGDVDKMFFTGSVATGQRVARRCAERLVPYSLELGGSDPAVVLDDADLSHAARGIAWGRFSNAGQTCVAPKRVYVAATVHDAFVEALERAVGRLRLRRPNDDAWEVGALVTASAVDPLARLRDAAAAGGARVVTPAGDASMPGLFPPTLLLDVPTGAAVLQEETFGPLLPIIAVPDAATAVALANASPFGLSASVWSRSRARAREVALQLNAGTVVINDVSLAAGLAEVPHGGMKQSGHGRSHGLAGLEECVRTRTVVDDILPGVRQPWWFPYGASMTSQVDGYVRLAHGRSLRERLSGLPYTLRLLLRKS
jgi:acyl-CoA reductase-like NAD-dependent aldehyde dehydrogenase